MLAPALVMGGALTMMETAVGGDVPEGGSCSIEVAAAPMTVASASQASAAPVGEAPAVEPAAAAESPPPSVAASLTRQEPTSPPGACGVAERAAPNGTLVATTAEPAAVEAIPATPEATQVALAPAPAPQAAPAPVKATPRAETAPKRAKPRPKPSPDQAPLAWWPAKVDDALNLVYAGEASFTPAIVLLFDGTFEDPALANKVIRVTSDDGEPIPGQWVVATNKRMLLFKASPGRYRVKVGGELVDGTGRRIATAQGGPVEVATR